jgi:hypothetical protein
LVVDPVKCVLAPDLRVKSVFVVRAGLEFHENSGTIDERHLIVNAEHAEVRRGFLGNEGVKQTLSMAFLTERDNNSLLKIVNAVVELLLYFQMRKERFAIFQRNGFLVAKPS